MLADSPELYWRLGDAGPTTATDASGNGNDGAVGGGSPTFGVAGLLVGDANHAVQCATVLDFIDSSDAGHTFTGPTTIVSVECLVEWNAAVPFIGSSQVLVGIDPCFSIELTAPDHGLGTVVARGKWSHDFGSTFTTGTGVTLNQDTIYHLALEADGTNVILYVNGSAVDTTSQGGAINYSGNTFAISGMNMAGNTEVVDEPALYRGSLVGATRWLAHYAASITGAGGLPISSLTPNHGPPAGGTPVVIAGSGFTPATSVTFDGNSVAFTIDNDGQITTASPAHAAGSGTVVVT